MSYPCAKCNCPFAVCDLQQYFNWRFHTFASAGSIQLKSRKYTTEIIIHILVHALWHSRNTLVLINDLRNLCCLHFALSTVRTLSWARGLSGFGSSRFFSREAVFRRFLRHRGRFRGIFLRMEVEQPDNCIKLDLDTFPRTHQGILFDPQEVIELKKVLRCQCSRA
jgi:hypothetical protein